MPPRKRLKDKRSQKVIGRVCGNKKVIILFMTVINCGIVNW